MGAHVKPSGEVVAEFDSDAMQNNADAAARLLKLLANGQRLRVLCLLVEGEMSVGQLNERIPLSQSALSQHLARLREQGLVSTRRDAQMIYYRLCDGPTRQIIAALHRIYCSGASPDANCGAALPPRPALRRKPTAR